MDLVKAVSRNTFFLMGGELASKLISFFVSIFFVRYLGRVELGKYSLAMAYMFFFGVLPGLSNEAILAREMAVRKDEEAGKWLGQTILMRLLFSVAAMLLAWGGLLFTPYTEEIRLLIFIASLGLLASFRTLFIAVFQKKMQMGTYAFTSVILNLTSALFVILVILFGGGVMQFIVLNTVMAFFSAGVYFFLSRSRVPISLGWNKKTAFDLLRSSVPLTVSQFFDRILARMDQLILFSFMGAASLGLYSATVTVVESLLFIPASLLTTLLPVLSTFFVQSPKKHQISVELGGRVLALVAFPASLGFCFYSRQIMLFLFGAGYLGSGPILRILSLSLPLVFLLALMRNVLISAQRQKMILWGAVAAAAVNIPLNFLFIPRWGGPGAALATTLAYVFPLLCFLLDRVSRQVVLSALKGVLKIIPAAAGMALCFWWVPAPWGWGLTMAYALFGILLVCTGGLNRSDWGLFKRAVWSKHA